MAAAFAAGTLVLVGLVVVLAWLTMRELAPDPTGGATLGDRPIGVGELYLNVTLSQGIVLLALAGLAWATATAPDTLGLTAPDLRHVGGGLLLGVVLFAGNVASVRAFDRLGIGYTEDLRRSLAPKGTGGWAVLLLVVLPLIALTEEALFRAALIGGLEAAFGLPGPVLVVASAGLFAVGHGMQGTGGILATAALGAVLAYAFVLTQSLVLVVIAHYVVNALEFAVFEGPRAPRGVNRSPRAHGERP